VLDGPSDNTDSRHFDDHLISVDTIGEAWIAVGRRILETGLDGTYDGLPVRELLLALIRIEAPSSSDQVIERFASEEHLSWMHANFTDPRPVSALGDADSYATRLRDYDHQGRDQVQWVVERLRADGATRSATITTLQPLSDSTYVPCVSLLDFYLADGRLHQVAFAHSIDFGTKGFANLLELARLQEEVAKAVGSPVGTLTMLVKSAHVYDSERDYLKDVVSDAHEPH
jgi:thymidylate synthase